MGMSPKRPRRSQLPGVFISYSWDDEPCKPLGQSFVDHLYRTLKSKFGSKSVFRDKYSLQPGDNIETKIPQAALDCDVMFAVVGNNWLRRLQKRESDPDDLLRKEIVTALERGIPVIPIFYRLSRLPQKTDLPLALRELPMTLGIKVEGGLYDQRSIANIAERNIRQGCLVLQRLRRLLSGFVSRSEIVRSTHPDFRFLLKKNVPGYTVDFRIYLTLRTRFSVAQQKLREWIDDNRNQPAVLLFLPRHASSRQFGFLLLSDWVREHPDCLAGPHTQIEFNIHKRTINNRQKQVFTASLERAHKSTSGLRDLESNLDWWTPSRSPKMALEESELFRAVGRFSRLEVPLEVLTETASMSRSEHEQFLRNRYLVRTSLTAQDHREIALWLNTLPPATQLWVRTLLDAPKGSDVQRESQHMYRFVQNVYSIASGSRRLLSFPNFSWSQVNIWRVAFQVFPSAGLEMLKRFFDSHIWNRDSSQLAGTLLLLSPLVVAGDRYIGDKAVKLIRDLHIHFDKSHPKNDSDYFVRANYFAVRAEAGDDPHCLAYRSFSERPNVHHLELKIMRHYYGQDDLHSATVVREKLNRPTSRLVNTLPHEEWRADLLRKRGLLV
jgi:hypothetical protein